MKTIARDSSELSSSMHAVLSNDDLLIEILLRLPFFSLHLLKFVSKRWLALITDPTFTLRRRNRNPTPDPPSGLFLRLQGSIKYDFLPFDARNALIKPPLGISLGSSVVEIVQSCNGLLLCKITGIGNKFYVYNPLTNRFKMVPPSPYWNWDRDWNGRWRFCGLRMAFDPSKSHHYKLIYATSIDNNPFFLVQIQTYSSETCSWSVCDNRFPNEVFIGFNHVLYWTEGLFRGFSNGIYWNDAIHWLNSVYRDLHYMLNVENLNLTSIRTPPILNETMHSYQKLFETHGCLLLLSTPDTHSMQMNIYEMSKWRSEWSIKYHVDIDDIMMHFPDTWTKPLKWFCSSIRCIVVGNNEEDSFIVMEIYGKIVQYKIASKTIGKLYEFESVHSKVSFQFIASFASV